MKLVLIDGNAILHRAFHALPPLTTTSGELVNAVYGFVSIILKVIEDFHPEYLIVTFDRPKPTFRQTIYVAYQSKRPKMDEGLVVQIERVHEMVRAMKIPIFEKDGYEADDVLGTLVRQAKKCKVKSAKLKVIIVTGDRDILQLVNKNVGVYMPVKGLSEAKLYGEKEVEEKFGIKPKQIIDYKALIGDSSDNYAGVLGIGPKTASDLLRKYQTLAGIYKNLDKLPETVSFKLKEGRGSADLAKQLATIVTCAPVKLDLKLASAESINNPDALEMLNKLEFHSLLKRMPGYKQELKIKNEKLKNKETNKNQLGLF